MAEQKEQNQIDADLLKTLRIALGIPEQPDTTEAPRTAAIESYVIGGKDKGPTPEWR